MIRPSSQYIEKEYKNNMGNTTFQGLGALRARRDAKVRDDDGEKVVWFSKALNENDGIIKVRFMQELSEDSENYRPEWGTYFGATEHQAPGPKGFMSRALDTSELEGRDWAQEQHLGNTRLGWHKRENFYINVAIEYVNGQGEKQTEVAILSRPITHHLVEKLIDIYDEEGSITAKTYWIKKEGSGFDTKWKLTTVRNGEKLGPDDQISFDGLEPYDLAKRAVIHVPYADQEEFYMRNADVEYALRKLAEKDGKKAERSSEGGDEAQAETGGSSAGGGKKYSW